MAQSFFNRHQEKLERAMRAIAERTCWSGYPEIPSGKIYGETAKADGTAAFQARQNKHFELDQPGAPDKKIGAERSPFGFDLGITYPQCEVGALVEAGESARKSWGRASVEDRFGVCLEILDRLNKNSFEMANAVMHTTGQAFMMAFQAGGPHAQDRGLEALAYAYRALTETPGAVTWEKKVSKTDSVRLNKTYRIMPRGVAAVIGCSTFPTWNGYPGLFASLATGNAVIVKPHPGAALPLAITVETARAALAEAGFDPNVITLLVDTIEKPVTKDLVTHPGIRIVDYTGGGEFGDWVEENAKQAIVFSEKAGVNPMVIDSIENLKATTGNIAFTLSLYSGQMCTTPQNIFIPRDGVTVDGEHKSFDEVASAIVGAVNWFLSDAKRAVEVLGAIQNERTVSRIEQAVKDGGEVLRPSESIAHEHFPEARIHSPAILKVDAKDEKLFLREMFGPIVYLIATDNTDHSIALAARGAKECGAITAALYSSDEAVIKKAVEATSEAGVPLSVNLTGQIFVNQSAAFSDFHVSGANPSGNATLCDAAFIAGRFRVVQHRVQVPIEAEVHAGV